MWRAYNVTIVVEQIYFNVKQKYCYILSRLIHVHLKKYLLFSIHCIKNYDAN